MFRQKPNCATCTFLKNAQLYKHAEIVASRMVVSLFVPRDPRFPPLVGFRRVKGSGGVGRHVKIETRPLPTFLLWLAFCPTLALTKALPS